MNKKLKAKKFIENNYIMINSMMTKEENNEIKDVSKILLESINQSINQLKLMKKLKKEENFKENGKKKKKQIN